MKKRNPIYTAGSFLPVSIDPVDGSLQRSTGTGGGHADAFRHCNTGCHSRTPAEETTFRAGIRRTPREGLAAQAGRGNHDGKKWI